MSHFVYEIDDHDRIVALGGNWDAFADANGGGMQNLIGRRLSDFILGDSVREIYAAVVAKARSGRPVRFRFRCYAPAWRREFEMKVVSTTPARVTFVSTMLRESPRPAVPLFGPSTSTPSRLVTMCSWCHAVALTSSRWRPLEAAIESIGLMDEMVGVTHGICPSCAERMFGILNPKN